MATYIIDIECNNLLHKLSKFYVMVTYCIETKQYRTLRTKEDVIDFIDNVLIDFDIVACHAIFSYDLHALQKLFGINYTLDTWRDKRIIFVDTLIFARIYCPHRKGGHGLASWGVKFGIEKPPIEDFETVSQTEIENRCREDVNINSRLFLYLIDKTGRLWEKIGYNVLFRANYLMSLQGITGVTVDIEEVRTTIVYFKEEIRKTEAKILPFLPKVKGDILYVPSTRTRKTSASVKKETGADREISVSMLNFLKKYDMMDLTLKEVLELPDMIQPMSKVDLYATSHILQLKNLLINKYGWKPTLWNTVDRVENGRTVKKPTTPKFQDKGELCPNLETIAEKETWIKELLKWSSLKHRLSILINKSPKKGKEKPSGWVNNDALLTTGRLPAYSVGLANTMRQRHGGIVNLPRVDKVGGREIRGLLKASIGFRLVGYDASAIEDRIKAHYAYEFDGGEYARRISDPDYDAHTDTQQALGLSSRNDAKPINYGLQYNMGAIGLANTLRIGEREALSLYCKYWLRHYGWKKCLDKMLAIFENKYSKKGIVIPEMGVFIHSTAHKLGNRIIQPCSTYAVELSFVLMDKWLGGIRTDATIPYYLYKGYIVRRLLSMHDEGLWEGENDIADELGRLGCLSIKRAGEILKLKVQLESTYKVGDKYSEIH